MTLEESILSQVSPSLSFFTKTANGYKFQCPYCQHGCVDKEGKSYSVGKVKGSLYLKNNSLKFKCFLCGTHKEFYYFLADHFAPVHLDYLRQRDSLGLTGYQTNCPALQTVLKNDGVLSDHPPRFSPPPVRESQSLNQNHSVISDLPKYTRLPRLSPQQQAGCQSSLNHLIKEREKRRRERSGELW